MSAERTTHEEQGPKYRLEIAGPADPTWGAWFEADRVVPAGDTTIIEVRVADQSELYGRLRRIHDLNLRLVSLARLDPGAGAVSDE